MNTQQLDWLYTLGSCDNPKLEALWKNAEPLSVKIRQLISQYYVYPTIDVDLPMTDDPYRWDDVMHWARLLLKSGPDMRTNGKGAKSHTRTLLESWSTIDLVQAVQWAQQNDIEYSVGTLPIASKLNAWIEHAIKDEDIESADDKQLRQHIIKNKQMLPTLLQSMPLSVKHDWAISNDLGFWPIIASSQITPLFEITSDVFQDSCSCPP